MTRRLLCDAFFLAIYLLISVMPCDAQEFKGVNLAGPESQSSRIPGIYGRDYVYPKPSEITYFTLLGMNVFRVPVLWERLQPRLNGPLDPAQVERLSAVIAVAQKNGADVIIDIHNYGRYRGVDLGTTAVPIAAFVDLWTRLAQVYGKNNSILFGLMNEPQIKQKDVWRAALQQTIDAIRKEGAHNQILVSGVGWDGAHNFVSVSGASLNDLVDPDHRMTYEVHQYFDANFSGTTAVCGTPDQAQRSLTEVTAWMRAGHRRVFLSEFGVARSPQCLADLNMVLNYLRQNSDVWQGWTYWAGGPRWGDYMFTAEPLKGKARPQVVVMEKYLVPGAP